MSVTAAGCRNLKRGQWLHLEKIESIFKEAAELLSLKGVKSEIISIRCGTPGFTLIVLDEDDNECRYTAFHGGSQGSLLFLGRNQRYDVVTAKNIAKAILQRI